MGLSFEEPPLNEPIIRALMMPKDTNHHGTVFGGTILSLIDQAAGIVAARRARADVVTLQMDAVVFHNPVFPGDLVSVYAAVIDVGRTSIRTRAQVLAIRRLAGEQIHVTSAQLVFVAIGPDGRPMPVPPDGTVPGEGNRSTGG